MEPFVGAIEGGVTLVMLFFAMVVVFAEPVIVAVGTMAQDEVLGTQDLIEKVECEFR